MPQHHSIQYSQWIVATIIPSMVTRNLHSTLYNVSLASRGMLPATIYICLSQCFIGIPVPPHRFPQRGKGFRCPRRESIHVDTQVRSCLISQHTLLH